MKVCVFGAGNMGARIAEVFLTHDHDVTLVDIKNQFLEGGVKRIDGDLSCPSLPYLSSPRISLS